MNTKPGQNRTLGYFPPGTVQECVQRQLQPQETITVFTALLEPGWGWGGGVAKRRLCPWWRSETFRERSLGPALLGASRSDQARASQMGSQGFAGSEHGWQRGRDGAPGSFHSWLAPLTRPNRHTYNCGILKHSCDGKRGSGWGEVVFISKPGSL